MKQLVIFAFILMLTSQQSGGGGSSSGGGSGGSGGGGSDYDYDNVSGDGNGNSGNCSEGCWATIAVVFSLVFVGIVLYKSYKNGYLRFDSSKIRDKKQRLLTNFIQNDNTSTRDVLLYGLEIIQSSNWNMSYYQNAWSNVNLVQKEFAINFNQELNKHCIDIKLRSYDSFGYSTYNGHLKQSNNQWKIFMIKTYDDKIKAKQFGDYAILIYEGITNQLPEGFVGKWYFDLAKSSNGDWKWSNY